MVTRHKFLTMTKSLRNSVQLIGNVGRDVDMVNFDNGNVKATVSLATNDFYTNQKGEKIKQTEWHNLIAWGKTAALLKQLIKKGTEVAINGKLTSRSYVDKSGATKYVTEIVVNDFVRLGKPEDKSEPEIQDNDQETVPF